MLFVCLGFIIAVMKVFLAVLGTSWAILVPTCAPLEPSWGHPGANLGSSWVHLGPSWGYLGAILGHLGASSAIFGPTRRYLGPSWAIVGHLGPSWGHLGFTTSHLGAILVAPALILGPSWASRKAPEVLKALFFHMCLIIFVLVRSWLHTGDDEATSCLLGAILALLGPTWGHSVPSWRHVFEL